LKTKNIITMLELIEEQEGKKLPEGKGRGARGLLTVK